MSDLPVSHSVIRAADLAGRIALNFVTLDYEARFLRRKVLQDNDGRRFLVDLSETISLDSGDCFEIGDEYLVEIRAAAEPLLAIEGPDLVRLAWHIGNRHTPCQLDPERLVIRQDKVIADMLTRLGASLIEITAPFTPEGGAYGVGRTHGHDHFAEHGAKGAHGHHGPGHAHVHSHGGHGHSHDHDERSAEDLTGREKDEP